MKQTVENAWHALREQGFVVEEALSSGDEDEGDDNGDDEEEEVRSDVGEVDVGLDLDEKTGMGLGLREGEDFGVGEGEEGYA